jgi:hypothetical protein
MEALEVCTVSTVAALIDKPAKNKSKKQNPFCNRIVND